MIRADSSTSGNITKLSKIRVRLAELRVDSLKFSTQLLTGVKSNISFMSGISGLHLYNWLITASQGILPTSALLTSHSPG